MNFVIMKTSIQDYLDKSIAHKLRYRGLRIHTKNKPSPNIYLHLTNNIAIVSNVVRFTTYYVSIKKKYSHLNNRISTTGQGITQLPEKAHEHHIQANQTRLKLYRAPS